MFTKLEHERLTVASELQVRPFARRFQAHDLVVHFLVGLEADVTLVLDLGARLVLGQVADLDVRNGVGYRGWHIAERCVCVCVQGI